jgi:hypothetical protein
METGILSRIVQWPVQLISDVTSPVAGKVADIADEYFKEIVFVIGAGLLIGHAPKAALIGTIAGLLLPVTAEESINEDFSDAGKPVRYRFAAQVLVGGALAILEFYLPYFYVMRVGAGLGAIGIGCVLKRFYILV